MSGENLSFLRSLRRHNRPGVEEGREGVRGEIRGQEVEIAQHVTVGKRLGVGRGARLKLGGVRGSQGMRSKGGSVEHVWRWFLLF